MTIRNFAYFKRKIHEINKIVDADEERRQVIELQSIETDLEEVQESFSGAIYEISTLAQFLDRPLYDESFFISGKEALTKIRMRYARNQSSQAVKQGRDFSNLTDAGSEAIKAKAKALHDAKKIFVKNNLINCDDPARIKPGLVMTKSNEKTFSAYERLYSELLKKINAMGREGFLESLSDLKTGFGEIKKIYAQFEMDYPEFVDEFMRLIKDNRGGVKLSELSIEQLNWLKENDLAQQYRILPNLND